MPPQPKICMLDKAQSPEGALLGLTQGMITKADRMAGWDFHTADSLSVDY